MTNPAVDLNSRPYVESEDFVPNATDVFGTLDTSATAGAADSKPETVSPIFEVAKQEAALQAARALDPEDSEVDASLVVLPEFKINNEQATENVKAAAKAAEDNPVVPGGLSPYQAQAAESGDEAAEEAQAEQEQQGAGTGSTGTADTSRQTGGASASSSTAKPGAKGGDTK